MHDGADLLLAAALGPLLPPDAGAPVDAAFPPPRVGFYGVIDRRLDLELVAAIADRRPGLVARHDCHPARLPEYAAAGLPVIATSIADDLARSASRDLVRIADTPEEFSHAIDAAIGRDRAAHFDCADRWLDETSWDRAWQAIDAELDQAVTRGVAELAAG